MIDFFVCNVRILLCSVGRFWGFVPGVVGVLGMAYLGDHCGGIRERVVSDDGYLYSV